jgi:hypothetical protein
MQGNAYESSHVLNVYLPKEGELRPYKKGVFQEKALQANNVVPKGALLYSRGMNVGGNGKGE